MRKSPDPKAQDIAQKIAVSSSGKSDEFRLEQVRAFAGNILKKLK